MTGPGRDEPARRYPLAPPQEPDERFSFALLVDVTCVLANHGYPEPTGLDSVHLQAALYAFLYAPDGTGEKQ